MYRFLPHKTKGEGFFLAALRKRADECDETPSRFLKTPSRMDKKKKGKDAKQPLSVPREAKDWLKESDAFNLTLSGTSVVASRKLMPRYMPCSVSN